MPKYRVRITAIQNVEQFVEIEAKDKRAATAKAEEALKEDGWKPYADSDGDVIYRVTVQDTKRMSGAIMMSDCDHAFSDGRTKTVRIFAEQNEDEDGYDYLGMAWLNERTGKMTGTLNSTDYEEVKESAESGDDCFPFLEKLKTAAPEVYAEYLRLASPV